MTSELNASHKGRYTRGLARTRGSKHGRRALVPGLAVAAAALIAACGGPGGIYGTGGGSAAGGTTGQAHHAAASHGTVISTRTLPGVGTVLVGRSGKTLYSPEQEGHGKIMCTGGCLSFWFPVSVAAGATPHLPTGATGVLGTIHRADDGLTQLTYNGKPLYTFRLDQAPGQVHGNNFTDHFGSASFTWQAITASGTPAGMARPGNASGYSNQGGSSGY